MTETAARPEGPEQPQAPDTAETPVKRGPGRPRALPLEQQRRSVLDAARAVFAESGYHGATIEAVARRSGIARPTVYELFGGKGRLFEAVLDDAAERVVRRLSAGYVESAEFPLAQFVRHNYTVTFELWEHDRDAVTVLLAAEQDAAGGPAATPDVVRRRVLHDLAELTRARWAALGVEIGESADLLAVMFFRMAEGLAVRHANDVGFDRDALIDLLTEFTLGGIGRLWDQSLDVLVAAGRRVGAAGT
jgi:AcrR family transcriptional regulator